MGLFSSSNRQFISFDLDEDGHLPSASITLHGPDQFVICLSDGNPYGDTTCLAVNSTNLNDLRVLITAALDTQ